MFLALGFQVALFVHRAAVAKIISDRDSPDTVYVVSRALAQELLEAGQDASGMTADGPRGLQSTTTGAEKGSGRAVIVAKKESGHSASAEKIRKTVPRRNVETFRFNPNTVSVEDLMRLGFSPKQAEAIDNYRRKGGRYRRKSDFAASFVVADSVFKRLENYIDIPLVDINRADSAAFDGLPGIGPYFAAQMVRHRKELHGYSRKEQLMEIWHFDREKFDALKDLITISQPQPYPIWTLPADSLRLHPHIHSWQTAKAIVLFRENNPPEKCTVEELEKAGVLTTEQASALALCLLAPRR